MATQATVISRRSFIPRPGRSHISPNTKFKMPAPEYGLSRIGTNGMQLMSLNDCSPAGSRSSGSLGVTSGNSGSGGGAVSPALAMDAVPLCVDDHVEARRLRPSAVHREMQDGFPYFGDGQVTAVQGRIDVIPQRLFGVGRRHAWKRDEPAIPAAQNRARPDLAEHEVDQAVNRRGTAVLWRGWKVITSAKVRSLGTFSSESVPLWSGNHRRVTPASTLNSEAGHKSGLVGDQEQHRVADIDGFGHHRGQSVEENRDQIRPAPRQASA